MTTLTVAAAWLAFMTGLLLQGASADLASLALAGAVGAALVFLGFAAVSRVRTLPRRVAAERGRLAVFSLVAGTAVGLANLAANWAIASADPALRALLTERMATLAPSNAVIASPLVEEVAVRLFLMSAMVWVVFRVVRHAPPAFWVGLIGSSLIFAALHLARPLPIDLALANYYRAALLTKYALAGIPLGWIFWKWGLPYSILCHAVANAVHFALQSRLF
jgi:hypothetical protein